MKRQLLSRQRRLEDRALGNYSQLPISGSGSERDTTAASSSHLSGSSSQFAENMNNDQGWKRWIVLILNCLLLLGNYYAYDNPASLRIDLSTYLSSGSPDGRGSEVPSPDFDYLFGLLYSVYSLPNMVLPFFSGLMIDRFGTKKIILMLSIFVCVGQAIVVLGVWTQQPSLMLVGRALFGIGGESVSVAQSCITTTWFQNKELAFALGLNLAVPRVGSVLTMILSPLITFEWNRRFSGNQGVTVAFSVGLIMCLISFCSALCLVYGIGTEPPTSAESQEYTSPILPPSQTRLGYEQERLSTSTSTSSSRQVSRLNLVDKVAEDQPLLIESNQPKQYGSMAESVLSLPSTFWWLCVILMLTYGTIIPFNTILSEFLQRKWQSIPDSVSAGRIMGIPDTLSAVLVSVCGYIVDRYGRRASWLFFCSLSICIVHAFLILGSNNLPFWLLPVSPLLLLGVAYSFFGVAFWSAIACLFNDVPSEPNLACSPGRTTSSTTSPILTNYRHPLSRHGSEGPYNEPQPSYIPHRFQSVPTSPMIRRTSVISLPAVISANTMIHVRSCSLHQSISFEAEKNLQSQIALAYGVSTSAMNLSLTIAPLITAAIRPHGSGRTVLMDFLPVELYFSFQGLVASFIALRVLYQDVKHDDRRLERIYFKPS